METILRRNVRVIIIVEIPSSKQLMHTIVRKNPLEYYNVILYADVDDQFGPSFRLVFDDRNRHITQLSNFRD